MTITFYDMMERSAPLSLQRKGLILLLVLITFGFSISFRERDLGDTSLDVQNGIKLALWVLSLGVAAVNANQLSALVASPSGFALALLSGLALASATWSEKPLYSLACAIGFASYTALASLSVKALSDDEFYKIIDYALLAFVGVSFVAAILFPDLAWLPPSVEETYNRLQGLAMNPNNFGRITAFLFLIGFGRWITTRKPTFIMALSITFGLSGLILSGSRTALAASLLAAFLIYFRHHRFFRMTLLSLLVLIAIFLFFVSYGISLGTLFKTLSRTGLESEVFTLTGRTDLWSAALEMIREKPLFGWGFNGTEEHFSLMFNQDFYGTPVNPHQMFLHLTLGVGLIGAFLALIIFALRLKTLITHPHTLNDLMTLYILFYGLAEVDLFGTPLFTSLIFFRIALQDGALKGFSS
jgi:O-antigen ligase